MSQAEIEFYDACVQKAIEGVTSNGTVIEAVSRQAPIGENLFAEFVALVAHDIAQAAIGYRRKVVKV